MTELPRPEIDTILKTNTLTRSQYLALMTVVLSGREIDDSDYRAINQIFDRFRLGRIKVTES
ncbi:MAG: hypothetical protein ACFB9N_16755 [Geitlerinemataceae cyanobacterium]